MPMDAKAIFDAVAAKHGEAAYDFQPAVPKDGPRDACFKVKPAQLREVMQFLRDDPALRFDFLQDVTAVDWPKANVIECVYHLFSYQHRHEAVVKVHAPREKPNVPSVVSLWKTADWLEREQYDLYGVIFEGHPDLRRVLMPDDWVGHPMRKDYKEPKEYRGMPTSRPSPLDLLLVYDKAHKTDVMS
jgi:NADH-quinone oxidoreductase subunit C